MNLLAIIQTINYEETRYVLFSLPADSVVVAGGVLVVGISDTRLRNVIHVENLLDNFVFQNDKIQKLGFNYPLP